MRLAVAALLAAASSAQAFEPPSPFLGGTAPGAGDQSAALPPGDGREEVENWCAACHSLRMVTQQRLPRQRWDSLLDWMVAEQGMPAPDAETRARILDYLATHLGRPGGSG